MGRKVTTPIIVEPIIVEPIIAEPIIAEPLIVDANVQRSIARLNCAVQLHAAPSDPASRQGSNYFSSLSIALTNSASFGLVRGA